MGQDILRNQPVLAVSAISSRAFGCALENETVGIFLDRTISYCKDNRLVWRAKFVRICGKSVDRWKIFNYPGYKMLECPHCGAKACFLIVPNSE